MWTVKIHWNSPLCCTKIYLTFVAYRDILNGQLCVFAWHEIGWRQMEVVFIQQRYCQSPPAGFMEFSIWHQEVLSIFAKPQLWITTILHKRSSESTEVKRMGHIREGPKFYDIIPFQILHGLIWLAEGSQDPDTVPSDMEEYCRFNTAGFMQSQRLFLRHHWDTSSQSSLLPEPVNLCTNSTGATRDSVLLKINALSESFSKQTLSKCTQLHMKMAAGMLLGIMALKITYREFPINQLCIWILELACLSILFVRPWYFVTKCELGCHTLSQKNDRGSSWAGIHFHFNSTNPWNTHRTSHAFSSSGI